MSFKDETVTLEELRTSSDRVRQLASRHGGVMVVDAEGVERFHIVIPSTPLRDERDEEISRLRAECRKALHALSYKATLDEKEAAVTELRKLLKAR